MLNGIDISGWQEGLDLSRVPCDFVIIKGTGGNGYVSSTCDGFVQQAIALGKPYGVYHFAREVGFADSAINEARWFADNCRNYFDGNGIPVLDFETDTWVGQEWAREWLDEVYRLTGVRPLFYTYKAVLEGQDFSLVAAGNYGLWLAAYGANTPKGYEPDTPVPTSGDFPFVAMYQYCSQGRLAGWDGNLDLNVFYGDVNTWYAYARIDRGDATPAPTPAPTPVPASEPAPVPEVTPTPEAPPVTPSAAPKGVEIIRYSGADRNETAKIIAEAHKRKNKVVVKDTAYADGISAAAMLVTENANLVFDKTMGIESAKSFGIGGAEGDETIEGKNRYDTNLLILKRYLKDNMSIVVVSGKDWADGVSALGTQKPILLVSDYLNKKQVNALSKYEGLEFTILGSTAAVSKTVENQLEEIGSVTRLDGRDRFDTSKLVAKHFHPKTDTVILVNNWVDGVLGSQIGDYPVLLLSEHRNDDAKEYIQSTVIKRAYVIGAVTDERVNELFA